MKKIFVSTTLLAVLALASCGKSEVCNCASVGLEMMKEARDAKMDPSKMSGIETKYKADLEKCQKLGEGKTVEQQKAMEKELKECADFKEMEKVSKEMMGNR
jgi:hypothetical protein